MSNNIIQLNKDLIKHDLKSLVRSNVKEAPNSLLDKETDEMVNAQKYKHFRSHRGYRPGHYKRNFHTKEFPLRQPSLNVTGAGNLL